MTAAGLHTVELADAWVEGDGGARWRSGSGLGPSDGARVGCSLLEVDPSARLPRHTDSAEELVVVIEGEAEVVVGERMLRVAAVYAGSDVVTRCEAPVQPGGERERKPVE